MADLSPVTAEKRAGEIVKALTGGGDPEGAHADADQFVIDVLTALHAQSDLLPWVRAMVAQGLRVATAPGTRWYA